MSESYSYRPVEDRCHELTLSLSSAALETQQMAADAVVEYYKHIEAHFLTLADADDVLILETKRRVAEAVLTSVSRDLRGHDLSRKLFQEIVNLGFTNLERKGTLYLIYSKHCLDSGHPEEAIPLMEGLQRELKHRLHEEYASIHSRGAMSVPDRIAPMGHNVPATLGEPGARKEYDFLLSQEIARITAAECHELPGAYREADDKLAMRIGAEPELNLQLRRELADHALQCATSRACGFELCRELFEQLSSLGFADLSATVRACVTYSECCERQGRDEVDVGPLKQLEAELSDQLAKREVPAYRDLVMVVRRILFCRYYLGAVRRRLAELRQNG